MAMSTGTISPLDSFTSRFWASTGQNFVDSFSSSSRRDTRILPQAPGWGSFRVNQGIQRPEASAF